MGTLPNTTNGFWPELNWTTAKQPVVNDSSAALLPIAGHVLPSAYDFTNLVPSIHRPANLHECQGRVDDFNCAEFEADLTGPENHWP